MDFSMENIKVLITVFFLSEKNYKGKSDLLGWKMGILDVGLWTTLEHLNQKIALELSGPDFLTLNFVE
jgi:hypothetical protein